MKQQSAFWADIRIRKKLTFLTHEDEIQAKTYLFLRNGIPTKVSKLHGLYIQNFWNIFGVNLGIRHTRQMMASFADNIDFEETAVANVNVTVSNQFGHSSQVHQNNYGATTDGAAIIRKMKAISDKWWEWCSLIGEAASSSSSPEAAAGAQTGSGSASGSVVITIQESSEDEESGNSVDDIEDNQVHRDKEGDYEREEGFGSMDDCVMENEFAVDSDGDVYESEHGQSNSVNESEGGGSDSMDEVRTNQSEFTNSQEVSTGNNPPLDSIYTNDRNDPSLANYYARIDKFLEDHAEILGYNNTLSEDEAWATDYSDVKD
ncbi:hypothetical protein BCR33DRAFT_735056 [Rhizoclosmatium globosum]|uniref:Uncharacterized protein n=1 Tax=Rhizoclosmatium globosum TaxID=329046 RepID=A0A1Y2CTF3_9FUNG|nr:hypothetical protein BCR33DRAFT_735056 [Rhizoclosmatium globosum]|eukprot:ORY49635.1 hypothetical protein BCR33DRAFT_735056 [Rhizoclosmatium globosum]